jgi:hypothetical protein
MGERTHGPRLLCYVTKWCNTGGKPAKNRHVHGRTVDNGARI